MATTNPQILTLARSLIGGPLLALAVAASAADEAGSRPGKELLQQLIEAINAVKANYVEPVDDRKLIEGAISGMVNGLDTDSAYLDKAAFGDLRQGPAAKAGIGLEMGIEDGLLKVVSVIEDTPAFHGGVKSGDLISRIDETPVKGMTLAQAVERLRGKPGTPVTLSIIRQGETLPLSLTLKRTVIRVASVKSKWIEPGYAYIRLSQFQDSTAATLVRHLRDLYNQGELEGLLLDLRNNPGGLFYGAVGISAAFLPPDIPVVSTDGRTGDAKRTYRANREDYRSGMSGNDSLENLPPEARVVPLVVMVNGKSAAASEIVAGALQDYKRAVIVGTPTFGRASIQTVLPIANGSALKLTTSRWFTPKGRSVLNKGIIPDVILEEGNAPNAEFGHPVDDRQLQRALGILKKLHDSRIPPGRA